MGRVAFYLFFFIAILINSACSETKNISKNKLQKISIEDFENINSKSINVNVDDIKINGNELIFIVSYRGCKNKAFQLYWNGTYQKSIPPQVLVSLQTNDSKTENCNELISKKEIKFSIKDLQYKEQNKVQIIFGKSSFIYTY